MLPTSVCCSNEILIFFSLALFSPGIHNTRKKLINNYIWIKRSKDVIYLFCCQGHLKHFLENYVFCRKSGNDTCSRRWARGEGHVVCVIMTHCVQKSICDSPLISSHFWNYWKSGAWQLWLSQFYSIAIDFSIIFFQKISVDLTVTKQKSIIKTSRKKLRKHVKQNYNTVFTHL